MAKCALPAFQAIDSGAAPEDSSPGGPILVTRAPSSARIRPV